MFFNGALIFCHILTPQYNIKLYRFPPVGLVRNIVYNLVKLGAKEQISDTKYVLWQFEIAKEVTGKFCLKRLIYL